MDPLDKGAARKGFRSRAATKIDDLGPFIPPQPPPTKKKTLVSYGRKGRHLFSWKYAHGHKLAMVAFKALLRVYGILEMLGVPRFSVWDLPAEICWVQNTWP